MSVGKVVTSFLGNKLFDFVLHILDEDNAVEILDDRPPGTCILRLEVPPNSQNTKGPLKATYKYKTFIFTQTIEKITFKISVSKNSDVVKCKTNPKNYKYIRSLATGFLPALRLFVNEFVNNHNFIEKDLSIEELENELNYHKFLIYPQKDKIFISKRVEKVIKTASVGFDFESLSFVVDEGEGKSMKTIKSFNEYLLSEFLQIDFSNKLLVRAALGYQKDMLSDEQYHPKINFELGMESKDKLLEKICGIILREEHQTWRIPPTEVRSILRTIYELVIMLQTPAEKMEWINKGILDITIKLIQKNGNNEQYNEIPINITKVLLDRNTEGCEMFCKQILKIIDSETEWECAGIYSSLYTLIELPAFVRVFIKNLGIPKILDNYVKATIMLLRGYHKTLHQVKPHQSLEDNLPEIDEEDEISLSSDTDVAEDSDGSDKEQEGAPPVSGKNMLIPKLMLKSIQNDNKENEKKQFRDKIEYKRSATEELSTLAMNLGETYMTQDLTALLSQLQEDSESVKDRKAKRVPVSRMAITLFEDREIIPVNPAASLGFKNSSFYKVKCNILKFLSRLTRNWEYFNEIPNTLNLLFSELLVTYREQLPYDTNFKKLIYNVLANYADHVEFIHRFKFQEMTSDSSMEVLRKRRKKLDKFVWRVYNNLQPAIEMKNIKEAELLLHLLVEYMQNCPTAVMSSQVADVCMETLLRVKEIILSKGKLTVKKADSVPLINHLLEVLEQIAIQNNHGPMNEFLLNIMIERNEFWKFVMHYAGQILMNKTFEKVLSNTIGLSQLKKYRSQVFKYYRMCLIIIDRQENFYEKEERDHVPFAKEARENVLKYLNYFEFLLDPQIGFIPQLLNSNKGSFSLQREILLFLIQVFTPKYSIFLSRRSYIDAYIGYSYLNFIKLYHSVSQDENTFELIHLNLALLTSCAKNKNEKIIMKFYQLRVMDFLVREVNLEYEITLSKCLKKNQSNNINNNNMIANNTNSNVNAINNNNSVANNNNNNNNSGSEKEMQDSHRVSHQSRLSAKRDDSEKKDTLKTTKEEKIKTAKRTEREDETKHKKGGSWKKDRVDDIEPKRSTRGSWTEDDVKEENKKKGSWKKEDVKSATDATKKKGKMRGSWIKDDKKKHQSVKNFKEEKSRSAIYSHTLPFVSPPPSRKKSDYFKPNNDLSGINIPIKQKESLGAFLDSVATESEQKIQNKQQQPQQLKSPDTAKGGKVVIPGLRLDSEACKDNIARVGKNTVVSPIDSSAKSTSEELETETESTEETTDTEETSEEETPKKGPLIPKLSNVPIKGAGGSMLTSIPKLQNVPVKGDEARLATLSAPKISLKEIPKLSNVPIKGGETESLKLSNIPIKGENNALKLSNIPIKGENNALKLSNIPIKGDQSASSLAIPKLTNIPEKGKDKNVNLGIGEKQQKSHVNNVKGDVKIGVLSDLERQIDVNDPKFQLLFDKKKKENQEYVTSLTIDDMQQLSELYLAERNEHKIYSNLRVHIGILKLIFSLMLTQNGNLENLYSDQFPLDNKKLNIPFLLRCHLNHAANRKIIPILRNEISAMGPTEFRLLKLLSPRLFRKEVYKNLQRLATGAYGTVYSCAIKKWDMEVAIKLMEIPKSIHDRCVLHGIFDEVLILDKFKLDSRISQIYDYGTDDDYYWIVMKKYKCSLKHWRKSQTAPLSQNLALYLNIYMNILNTFQFLYDNNVNHFDVKCDNFLIQPLNEENWSNEDEEFFWHPTSDIPNFSVCLADFGESKIFANELDAYTTRNRGTEFTKSPEMLVVAYASQKTRSTYDRRKKVGASSPSDVWSLGCLLYELLTGEFLFYDQDWVKFYIRVTSPGQELIPPEKMEKIDNNQVLLEFLLYILRRDPSYRPSVSDVITRFKYVRARLTSCSGSLLSPRIPTPRQDEIAADHRLSRTTSNSSEKSHDSSEREEKSLSDMIANSKKNDQSDDNDSHHDNKNDDNNHRSGDEKKDNNINININNNAKQQTNTPPPSKKIDDADTQNVIDKPHIDKKRLVDSYAEAQYFIENCSKITEYLYIGCILATYNYHLIAKEYRVTHIINCTKLQIPRSDEFVYLQIPFDKSESKEFCSSLNTIFSFITEARTNKGSVLIISEDGVSRCAAVAIGYLMETRNWSFVEAFTFVKDCRYVIEVDDELVDVLVEWKKKQKSHKRQYQCLCGAVVVTVLSPFNQSYFPNPRSCSCKFGEPSKCPNSGCYEFLKQMRSLYQYPATKVMWGFTTREHMAKNEFSRSTREYIPSKELHGEKCDKGWTLFKCISCDYLTHALRVNDQNQKSTSGPVINNFDVAVVTNLPVASRSNINLL